MHEGIDLDLAERAAGFIRAYGAYAAIVILLFAVIYQYRENRGHEREKLAMARELAPVLDRTSALTEKLLRWIQAAAKRRTLSQISRAAEEPPPEE